MVSFGGIVSGIDTQAIVDQIIGARSQSIFQIDDRIAEEEARKSAIGDLRSTLSNLLSKVEALTNVASLNARTAVTTTSATNNKNVVSVAVDSTAALGSFTVSVEQLATATTLESQGALGSAVTQNVALNSAGFDTTITTGTFTINGTAITIDASTVLSDGVDDGASNSILGKINNAGLGVTASIVNDAQGRANALQLTSGSAITLGAGGDTSNFLEASHLLASPGTTTRTSTQGMGGTLASVDMTAARFATAFTQNTGTFKVNGVEIAYDADNESLNSILSKINASGAGVTATYDGFTDSLKLTADDTGSQAISVADVTGNFLQVVGLVDGTNAVVGTETLGNTAQYKINGGATRYASSNTVTDVLPGVNLTLLEADPGNNATVTVDANDQAIVTAVDKFVTQYNSTMELLGTAIRTDPEGTSGPLSGDGTFRLLEGSLRSLVTSFGENLTGPFTNLLDVGLSFGAVGAELGSTDTLSLDSEALTDAIAENRDAVIALFSAKTFSAAFGDGAGSLNNATGAPTTAPAAGTYTITDDGAGNLSLVFAPDDGGLGFVSNGTITAGGSNDTLIVGMTLFAANPLTAGTDTITVTRDKIGVAVKFEELLDTYLQTGGTLDTKTDTIDAVIEDSNERITQIENRLIAEQQRLERQFAQMEQIFAKFQQQQQYLGALTTQLSSLASATKKS